MYKKVLKLVIYVKHCDFKLSKLGAYIIYAGIYIINIYINSHFSSHFFMKMSMSHTNVEFFSRTAKSYRGLKFATDLTYDIMSKVLVFIWQLLFGF